MLLTTVFLFLMIISDSMVAVVIYWNLVYIFKSCVFSVAFSLPHQLLPKEAIGTGMGMVNTGAQAAGFVAPIQRASLLVQRVRTIQLSSF